MKMGSGGLAGQNSGGSIPGPGGFPGQKQMQSGRRGTRICKGIEGSVPVKSAKMLIGLTQLCDKL